MAALGGAIPKLDEYLADVAWCWQLVATAQLDQHVAVPEDFWRDLAEACQRAYYGGRTLEQIGKAAGGYSRERIRQLIGRYGTNPPAGFVPRPPE